HNISFITGFAGKIGEPAPPPRFPPPHANSAFSAFSAFGIAAMLCSHFVLRRFSLFSARAIGCTNGVRHAGCKGGGRRRRQPVIKLGKQLAHNIRAPRCYPAVFAVPPLLFRCFISLFSGRNPNESNALNETCTIRRSWRSARAFRDRMG